MARHAAALQHRDLLAALDSLHKHFDYHSGELAAQSVSLSTECFGDRTSRLPACLRPDVDNRRQCSCGCGLMWVMHRADQLLGGLGCSNNQSVTAGAGGGTGAEADSGGGGGGGAFQHALLSLAATHAHFGHTTQALTSLNETVRRLASLAFQQEVSALFNFCHNAS